MSPRPRRRERTRFLQLGAVVGLAVILLGTDLLLRQMPTVDRRAELRVEGMPPLAMADVVGCTRRPDDTTADELRAAFPAGGRVSSLQVYACPAAYEDLRVAYVGEAIGELLPRRDGAWVQVNDDDYALEVGPVSGHRELRGFSTGLSVWLPDGLHERIGDVGRPGRRGDVVLLTGRLLRTDPADGGGITLRASELTVLAPAIEVPAPLHRLQALVAAVLFAVALAMVVWSRSARQR